MGIFGPPNIEKLEAKNDIDGLIKAMDYKHDKLVRGNAASALGKMGAARAVEPLSKALKDPDKYVKDWAANSLGKIGDDRAVRPLIAALKDKDICGRAAEALGNIGDPQAVEPLIETYTNYTGEYPEPFIRALGKLKDKRAVGVLKSALKNRDYQVRSEAVNSLVQVGGSEIYSQIPNELLLEHAKRVISRNWSASRKEFFEKTTWKAYKKIDTRSLIDDFYNAIEHGSKEGILADCLALGLKGTAGAISELRKISKTDFEMQYYDSSHGGEIRDLAVLILKSLGDDVA